MSRSILSLKNVALSLAAVTLAAMTTGCAMVNDAVTETPGAMISGVVHGGQSPIQGATVTMYSTTSNGYGAAGTVIGTATSDANGNFTISPSVTSTTCPSGQYAYITAMAGYPTGQSSLNNTGSLLAAAVGPCSGVSSSTQVVINEVTTVAFGYALGNFTTTSAATGGYKANVGAPTANNAATGTATTSAGLAHAFTNAANLASYSTGAANSQTATINTTGTTIYGSVPAAEINTLADILAACVDGATGNANCTTLFGFTTSISGTTPLNSLQAMIYLARNPYPSAAAMNATTGLFSLVAASGSPFTSALTAPPPDWGLAVVYVNEGTTANDPFVAQYFTALDANDTIYTGRSATAANLIGMNAYGTSVPAYTAGGAGTATRQIAPDALGNVFLTNNAAIVYQYSASGGGAPTTFATLSLSSNEAYGVAVDKLNNVWVANAETGINISEYAYSSGSYTLNYTATAPGAFQPVWLSIDGNQNVWEAGYYTNGTLAGVLANLTPGGTATYTASGTSITPISQTFASTACKPLGMTFDASGNAWYGIVGQGACTTAQTNYNTPAVTGVEEVTPVTTSSVITSLNPQSEVDGTAFGAYATGIPGIDGAGTIFAPDNDESVALSALGIHTYASQSSKVLSPASGFLGCYLGATASTSVGGPGTGTTCGNVLTAAYANATDNPRTALVDSTGSVWAGITTGGFTQFIGLGAPTYPLAASGKPGLAPGLTSAQALP